MAHLTRSAVYLPVHDVEATIDYYRRSLDFETEYVAGQPAQFAIVSRSGFPIMLRRVGEDTPLQPHRGSEGAWDVFFWTNDAKSLCEEFERKAIQALYGPVQQPYGILEFAIADCNGYVIGFGEAV